MFTEKSRMGRVRSRNKSEVFDVKEKQQILREIFEEFSDLKFVAGKRFKYRYPNTVYYVFWEDVFGDSGKVAQEFNWYLMQLLHEVGHARCQHKDYVLHIERLRMESEAWEKARQIILEHKDWQERYGLFYDEDFAEQMLGSYRDWLHKKSTCPKCTSTRIEIGAKKWQCPNCDLYY